MPLIIENYVEPGLVYFRVRDFPLTSIHPGAFQAAVAARCAGEQAAYWQMHDRLFEGTANREWGRGGSEDLDVFLAYAIELDLDADELGSCVRSGRYDQAVTAEQLAAEQLGLRGTPAFLVNGQLLVGAYPYSVWQEVIEGELAKAANP